VADLIGSRGHREHLRGQRKGVIVNGKLTIVTTNFLERSLSENAFHKEQCGSCLTILYFSHFQTHSKTEVLHVTI
jgi:hypothetical protein